MTIQPNKRLKIGLVLDDSLDKADGVQQYVISIGEWLRSQGHDVHYLVSTTTRTDITNVHSLAKNIGVRFNGNRMSMPLPAPKARLKQLLRTEQFDVLHVQMPYSPLLAQRIIAAAPGGTAIVGTFHIVPHGRHVSAASRGLALWTSSSLKRFNGVVSVSAAAQAFAKRTFKLDSTILPNVVDVARFAKAEPLESSRILTVVFLGRLVPRKGCRILLQAVQSLSQRADVPAFRVIICGKGPLESELKAYVQQHQLQSNVSFKGFIDEVDKPRYLRMADIAVFPSTGGESFGIVLLEAMAAGALTLGADNSGYHTVLEANPRLLFALNDVAELTVKLQTYLQDTVQRQADAAWGADYVRRFDIYTIGHDIEQFYNRALRAAKNVQ